MTIAAVSALRSASVAFVNSGQRLLGNRLNTDGRREIHEVGEHTVAVLVMHRTKGNVAVRKYKSTRKIAQGNEIVPRLKRTIV